MVRYYIGAKSVGSEGLLGGPLVDKTLKVPTKLVGLVFTVGSVGKESARPVERVVLVAMAVA